MCPAIFPRLCRGSHPAFCCCRRGSCSDPAPARRAHCPSGSHWSPQDFSAAFPSSSAGPAGHRSRPSGGRPRLGQWIPAAPCWRRRSGAGSRPERQKNPAASPSLCGRSRPAWRAAARPAGRSRSAKPASPRGQSHPPYQFSAAVRRFCASPLPAPRPAGCPPPRPAPAAHTKSSS